MATVACPGCGMPRNESEIESTPCPVCATHAGTGSSRPLAKKKPSQPDPTDGLPSDASELHAAPRGSKHAPESGSRVLLVGAITFVLGTLCGVGGVLAFQAIGSLKPNVDEPEVATTQPQANEPLAKPQAAVALTIAPMPHEPALPPLIADPEPDGDPELKLIPLPLPGRVTTHEFNGAGETYSVPVLKKGEHIILKGKGKLKTLRVHGLDAGAVLDASELEAGTIVVTGKIDGRSTLKLKATSGTVQVSAKVDGRSLVEINAPGGDVRFMLATTQTRDGSKIDNGSTVAVTARRAEFKGDIAGTDTRVVVTLTRGGWLEAETVRGRALVEYKSQVADWAPPTVRFGSIAMTATVRKAD